MKMFDNDELVHLREADNTVSKVAVLEEANAHFPNETISTSENNLNRTVREHIDLSKVTLRQKCI